MAPDESSWSFAFFRQAQSDLKAYDVLAASSSLPSCHRLHSLQMWLEKLCKANLRLAEETRANLPEFRTSHNVIAKVLPSLIKNHWRKIGYSSEPNLKGIREICHEIDLLHPAIDQGGARPDNVEYPWATVRDGKALVMAPADASFRVADRLRNHVGRQIMKAATLLTNNPVFWSGI